MPKRLVFLFILLITTFLGFSQNPTQDSIAPKRPSPTPSLPIDSTFVTFNAYPFDSIFLKASKVVDTTTFHAAQYDYLQQGNTIYSTLSNTGMAHKSMRFNYLHQTGFDMTLPAFAALMQNESNMLSYLSILPYSEIRYLMTVGDLEQHFHVRFGRQVTPRLLISFAFDTDYAPATFNNNKTINNAFWVNAKYITKSERYGVCAYWYRNKLEMQENGGIVNDESYTSNTETDNSVIPVNLSNATNFVVSSGVGLEQYFNLLSKKKPQSKKEKITIATDSIAPIPTPIDSISIDTVVSDSIVSPAHQKDVQEGKDRKFTLGRICHSFSYQSNKLYYNETSPSATFYQPYDTLFNSRKTSATTIVRAFKNNLKWRSLG